MKSLRSTATDIRSGLRSSFLGLTILHSEANPFGSTASQLAIMALPARVSGIHRKGYSRSAGAAMQVPLGILAEGHESRSAGRHPGVFSLSSGHRKREFSAVSGGIHRINQMIRPNIWVGANDDRGAIPPINVRKTTLQECAQSIGNVERA
jgi:hypothetical protein